ncbi:uncharacterized protein ACB057_006791 [Neosynchiropus ocellatus]
MDEDEDPKTCYEGASVQSFNFYLERSGEHEAILEVMQKVLADDVQGMVEGKNNLDILGVGSGGGQVDVHILNLLQEFCPGVSLSTDIVEGSSELVDNFKALVKRTPSLQGVPFTWHVMHSEGFVKNQKKAKEMKKYDFIHMVQMIYYVANLESSLQFYRSILKPNGRIMIIIEADQGGWDTLWTTYKTELLGPKEEYRCSRDIVAALKKFKMEFEEHDIPNTFEITECFDRENPIGNRLLNFMTNRSDFQAAFSEDLKEKLLDHIRQRCSFEKDGKVFFKSDLKMILIYAQFLLYSLLSWRAADDNVAAFSSILCDFHLCVDSRVMDEDNDLKTCYEGAEVQILNFYLEKTGEHEAELDAFQRVLPPVIKRMAEGKSSLDILGVGSGGGQVDIQILNLLQEFCPGVSLSTDIVEGSCELLDNFKALVKRTPSVQNVPFTWHVMNSETYVRRERAKPEIKKFDFIHMVEMIYYVTSVEDTLKFYWSALKPNGKIMIIIQSDQGGWDTLYDVFKNILSLRPLKEYRYCRHIVAVLKKLGMTFQEHDVPHRPDITECFEPDNEDGQRMLSFLTNCDDFQSEFSPELKKSILDVLRKQCCTEKDGKLFETRVELLTADTRTMAAEVKHTCYEGDSVHSFQFYLEKSGEHEAILQGVRKILPPIFKRMAEGKSSLDVLGVGSGGGEADVQMLELLQNTCPGVSLSTDIVEGSSDLVDCFKALVKKTPGVQKVPFNWHVMHSEDYVKQEKAKADAKKFDFIHMIQMIYYVKDVEETLKFYRSALKPNGKIMVIIEAENSGWDTLWTTFRKDLWTGAIQEYRSSRDVVATLKKMGMKFQEHDVPNSYDITECFDPKNETGQKLLNFMTATEDFHSSFTPELRANMLDVLRERCSTKKDGKVFFKSDLKMILIDA